MESADIHIGAILERATDVFRKVAVEAAEEDPSCRVCSASTVREATGFGYSQEGFSGSGTAPDNNLIILR
jgi:hypothetical protein